MKKKITSIRIIPMLHLGLIYSCSPTVNVTSDYDHAANFSEYKTFAVYDLKAQEGQVNQLNVDRVTNAIRSEMIILFDSNILKVSETSFDFMSSNNVL